MHEDNPTVIVSLVDTAPGVKAASVSIAHTEDLVLVVNLLARAQVAVLEKLAEASVAQAAPEESRIVRPALHLVRPGGTEVAIEQNTTGYCVLGDVSALTGKSYTSSTMPSSATVESFIMERADIINGVLGAMGYSVPIPSSATRSSRVLLALNVRGAAADAEVSTPGIIEEPPRARVWREEFAERLNLIQKRLLDLPDATASSDTPTTVDNRTPAGAFNLDTDGDERTPVFDRDTDL